MYLCSYATKFTQYSSRDTATNVGISFTYLSVCFWFSFCVVWAYSLKLEPGCLANAKPARRQVTHLDSPAVHKHHKMVLKKLEITVSKTK